MPYFSIIIPVYKTEAFLEKCLQSIKDQTCHDFECLIIDDGSPGIDRPKTSQELIETNAEFAISNIFNYVCAGDPRFKVLYQANQGQGHAKNLGLRNATWERLVFIDSDDFLENDYLEKAYNKLKYQPNGIINYALVKTLEKGKYDDFKNSVKFLPKTNDLANLLVFPTWTPTPVNYFWKLEMVKKHSIQFRFAKKAEDTAFVIENILACYLESKNLKFEQIETYYIYRQFPDQITKTDNYEIELFQNTITFVASKLAELKKIGLKYEVLGRLFILRFSIYKTKLETQNKLKKATLTVLAKFLSLLAIAIAGTKKS